MSLVYKACNVPFSCILCLERGFSLLKGLKNSLVTFTSFFSHLVFITVTHLELTSLKFLKCRADTYQMCIQFKHTTPHPTPKKPNPKQTKKPNE